MILTCLAEIYNCAASDIVFHKVNDDLRIGFGGQANRTGIAIAYRQGYYLINDLGFSTIHTDLTAAGVVETFSTINQVILTPYIANPDGYGIDLTLLTGTLTAGIYYFRLTIMLDGYEEMLVADNSIKVDGTHDIQVNPLANSWEREYKKYGIFCLCKYRRYYLLSNKRLSFLRAINIYRLHGK